MKRIILIDSTWDIQSPAVQYALKVSKNTDTEISGIFLTSDSGEQTRKKAGDTLKTVKEHFVSEGINFSFSVLSQDPGMFLKKIQDLMPASLVMIGDVTFSDEMVSGGVSLESLRKKVACPVTTAVEVMAARKAEEKPAKGINWGKFLIYALGSAIMYGVFYPKIRVLNEKLFMTESILGAIAIMAVVVVHAWVWGNTTHILPRLFKLEK